MFKLSLGDIFAITTLAAFAAFAFTLYPFL